VIKGCPAVLTVDRVPTVRGTPGSEAAECRSIVCRIRALLIAPMEARMKAFRDQ